MMRSRMVWVLLLLMSWVSAATRLSPHAAQVQAPHPLHGRRAAKATESVSVGKIMGDAYGKESQGLGTLGSRPPSCEHKCGPCMPCVAVQVPTITGRLGPEYANYEPEGWKCKCRSSFFSP